MCKVITILYPSGNTYNSRLFSCGAIWLVKEIALRLRVSSEVKIFFPLRFPHTKTKRNEFGSYKSTRKNIIKLYKNWIEIENYRLLYCTIFLYDTLFRTIVKNKTIIFIFAALLIFVAYFMYFCISNEKQCIEILSSIFHCMKNDYVKKTTKLNVEVDGTFTIIYIRKTIENTHIRNIRPCKMKR